MVVVPAGSYQMGSPASELSRHENEGPVHEVTIAAPFALGRYEVTVREFGRFVDETGYSAGESCRVWEKDSVAACEGVIGGLLNECEGEDDEFPSAVLAGRHWRNPGFRQHESHPVTCVSWNDAQAYAAWLASVTGERYRLPSESEWEYAARAGNEAARYWEDLESESPHAPAESADWSPESAAGQRNWCWSVNGFDRTMTTSTFLRELLVAAVEQRYSDSWRGKVYKALRKTGYGDERGDVDTEVRSNVYDFYWEHIESTRLEWESTGRAAACSDNAVHTAPVAAYRFSANDWGLKHMLGNVSEWTEDCWNEEYTGAPADGSAWKEDDTGTLSGECDNRVLRGGSWASQPRNLRSAQRSGVAPGDANSKTGFRVARTIVVAPTLGTTLSDLAATLERDETIDLAEAFVDDRTLAYEARTSNADVARANVDGDVLTLKPVAEGTAAVTVTARNPDGNSATQTFAVTVAGSDGTHTGGGNAGDTFRDCAECPLMVRIPAGTFTMGAPESEPHSSSDERPQRTVSIPAFAAGAHEVTFAEWGACVAAGGCGCAGYRPDDEGWGRDDRPVILVSWNEAQLYADWLSHNTGHRYRLLTESEWEYAARAGTTTPFHTGGTITPQQANFDSRHEYPGAGHNESGLYRRQTVPVGSFAPNGFGLYDMHGNVAEWVQDCFSDYAAAPSDGSAVESDGCRRVFRGGSWLNPPLYLRATYRTLVTSDIRISYLGFRVARTL